MVSYENFHVFVDIFSRHLLKSTPFPKTMWLVSWNGDLTFTLFFFKIMTENDTYQIATLSSSLICSTCLLCDDLLLLCSKRTNYYKARTDLQRCMQACHCIFFHVYHFSSRFRSKMLKHALSQASNDFEHYLPLIWHML